MISDLCGQFFLACVTGACKGFWCLVGRFGPEEEHLISGGDSDVVEGAETTLLIADAHPWTRLGLSALLNAVPGLSVVAQAADSETACALAESVKPDIVIIDTDFPDLGGAETIQRILAADPEDPPTALLVTSTVDDNDIYAALHAGARGILLKNIPPEQMTAAVTAAARGNMVFSPGVMSRLVDICTHRTTPVEYDGSRLATLTMREAEVLKLVAKGYGNSTVAKILHISEATVKTHLNRAMGKLEISSRAQAVALSYEFGLVIPRQRVAGPMSNANSA
ncbi:response regulator transcription factor [Streptomyces milbemycinicus]|uniref:LuxR C-terminal-related transcriptional regulator n=1 Tax=Streptomyces milbemycinicus TaxID=476552 RepID=A0ABW8M1T3_9ACTN